MQGASSLRFGLNEFRLLSELAHYADFGTCTDAVYMMGESNAR